MSDPIRPDRLIFQAKALAGYGAGRGRPSPTNHRRAVSAAYYALFHSLIEQAVLRVFPESIATDDDRRRAARWIDHADLKQASNWILECAKVSSATATPPAKTGVKDGVWELFSQSAGSGLRIGAVQRPLRRIARTFVDLQDARHRADYDQLASFPKATAQLHVDAAENAVALLSTHIQDPSIERFLGAVTFCSRRLR